MWWRCCCCCCCWWWWWWRSKVWPIVFGGLVVVGRRQETLQLRRSGGDADVATIERTLTVMAIVGVRFPGSLPVILGPKTWRRPLWNAEMTRRRRIFDLSRLMSWRFVCTCAKRKIVNCAPATLARKPRGTLKWREAILSSAIRKSFNSTRSARVWLDFILTRWSRSMPSPCVKRSRLYGDKSPGYYWLSLAISPVDNGATRKSSTTIRVFRLINCVVVIEVVVVVVVVVAAAARRE